MLAQLSPAELSLYRQALQERTDNVAFYNRAVADLLKDGQTRKQLAIASFGNDPARKAARANAANAAATP